nr:Hypothetical protein [Aeromonas sp.]
MKLVHHDRSGIDRRLLRATGPTDDRQGLEREAAEFGKNRTLSRLGLSAFPVPLLPIRDLGSNGTKTQRRPAANVQLKYALTRRQAGTLGRVRIGPIPAFSDASPATSRAST